MSAADDYPLTDRGVPQWQRMCHEIDQLSEQVGGLAGRTTIRAEVTAIQRIDAGFRFDWQILVQSASLPPSLATARQVILTVIS